MFLFPAHAGMTRIKLAFVAISSTVPRPRGDDPAAEHAKLFGAFCSPPTRG